MRGRSADERRRRLVTDARLEAALADCGRHGDGDNFLDLAGLTLISRAGAANIVEQARRLDPRRRLILLDASPVPAGMSMLWPSLPGVEVRTR